MGSDRGGIRSLAATLEKHWEAVEADFTRYYATDLREAIETWTLNKVIGHVKHLPVEAALWREQGRKDFAQLFHLWAIAFAQLQYGKRGTKVKTPAIYDESTQHDGGPLPPAPLGPDEFIDKKGRRVRRGLKALQELLGGAGVGINS